MKKQIITILTAAAIVLIGSTCFGQHTILKSPKPGYWTKDSLKHYPGYKFGLPCVVKVTSLTRTTYFLLKDTAGFKNGPHYKANDLNRGTGGIRLSEKGLKPVTDKDKGKY